MSNKVDVSIIIVQTYERNMVRQTLRGIRRAAPKISFEVIVVDNNPAAGMKDVLDREFHEVIYVKNEKNIGFGGAMNVGIRKATGRYILIFNPDIVVMPGSLEKLVRYMDKNPQIGVCGPKLLNPDGTIQYSAYRQPSKMLPIYRRTPIGKLPFAKRAVEDYLMMHDNHDKDLEVDSLIGAALFTRAEVLREIGLFDERFFMYYEDNDLCRRFWEAGYEVMYHPAAQMIHYHRRASADGGLLRQLTSRFTWIHIQSAIKYFRKYRGKSNPRLTRTIRE